MNKYASVWLAVFSCCLLMSAVNLAFLPAVARADEPAEPLLRNLPPGIFVISSAEVSEADTQAIGQRLGSNLASLTNSAIRVHGRPIQVNVIGAQTEDDAQAVYEALLKIKPPPFCERSGTKVIEYVGNDLDAALAIKTSFELGIVEKPSEVRYQVVAELAPVDQADYLACNPLFNLLIELQKGANRSAEQKVEELSRKFKFGSRLALRTPFENGRSSYSFEPAALQSQRIDGNTIYTFGELPRRHGVPFVTTTMDILVDSSGMTKSTDAPPDHLTAATPFWPSGETAIVELAKRITAGKATNDEKAMAILEWLTPGQNLKYAGQTGSRWGTAKVLEQRFGHCWDFSDCFVTLARAAGVPARQVAGWLYGSSGHVWAEYYREGQGWQQVDPTGGGTFPCGIYHIAYFTTDDGEMPILYVAMPHITLQR